MICRMGPILKRQKKNYNTQQHLLGAIFNKLAQETILRGATKVSSIGAKFKV